MLYGMYVSAAGALANSYRQDVIANNLANVETVAFKRDLALFQGRRTEAQASGQRPYTTAMLEGVGGGIFALPTYTDFSPASLNETGSDYDLALTNKGFFQVQKGSEIFYTRDGRVTHDENNQLVTISEKLPVLDDAGRPIVIDPNLDGFDVDEFGLISQEGAAIGRLGIVDFEDTTVLRKQGQNLYFAGQGVQGHSVGANVKQGALEQSSVDAMEQLTEMIRTQRLFQTNVNALQVQDQTLGLAVSRLGNIT